MIELAEVEERLALFAEGISGRYLHIRATEDADPAEAYQSTEVLYLPGELDGDDPHAFHVLTLQQIGQRECGTFDFKLAEAAERLPELALSAPAASRDSDLTLFFRAFPSSGTARQLFRTLDLVRIDAHIRRAYPGAAKYMADGMSDLLATVLASGFDTRQLTDEGATVYDVAEATVQLYPYLAADVEYELIDTDEVSGVEWMQREARLEDWQEDEQHMSNQILAVEMMESEGVEAQNADAPGGEIRDTDIDLSSLEQDRDTLRRKIEMERAALRHATGQVKPGARSYRYDEWDMHHRRYLKKYCVLYEERLAPDADADLDEQRAVIRAWLRAVKPQLEQIRPTGLQRVNRVLDGDELDMNAVLEARQDIRAGCSPDERTYSRRERVHRDVCALFLVDLSASTDDPIEPVELPELDEWGDPVNTPQSANLRDPFEDHPMFADLEAPPAEPPRKIIDIQKEAMLVMASALDALGDNFGIYGFSGYGHDCVELFVAKEIGEAFAPSTLRSISAMSPKRSTRMGPAIRHGVARLTDSGHAMRVLIVVSDGFPQDCDYGPDRGDHEYGLMDTAKALQEAAAKGVETFCITVDRSGHDYLKRMCPTARYMVIEEMEDLPAALSKVYSALTAR